MKFKAFLIHNERDIRNEYVHFLFGLFCCTLILSVICVGGMVVKEFPRTTLG